VEQFKKDRKQGKSAGSDGSLPMDSSRSIDSARSDRSERSTASMGNATEKAGKKLAGTVLGQVLEKAEVKKQAKLAAETAKMKLLEAANAPKDKLKEMVGKRSSEEVGVSRLARDAKERGTTAAAKASTGKQAIKDKIEKFKKDRKKEKKSDLEGGDGGTALAITSGDGDNAQKKSVDPSVAFMAKGAFFVTATEASPAATIKLSMSNDFNYILWKEHTSKTEHSIQVDCITKIEANAVLREKREKLGFRLEYRGDDRQMMQGEAVRLHEIILEAISERVKAQWLEGLSKLTNIPVT